jgi:hypothetical protein
VSTSALTWSGWRAAAVLNEHHVAVATLLADDEVTTRAG